MLFLEDQTHKRKWGLIINGLEGKSGESEYDMRKKTIKFAQDILKVPAPYVPDERRIAACHRLKQADNAAIIIHFLDLNLNIFIGCPTYVLSVHGLA